MSVKSMCSVFCAVFALSFVLTAAEPYANKALNPVKFNTPAKHADIPLVTAGKLNFVIVCNLKAEKGIRCKEWKSLTHSAEILQDAFQRTTGQKPKVVAPGSAEAKQAKYVIALGKSELTDKLGLKPLSMPKEAFLVRSFDRGVVIAGHDGSLIPGSYNKMDWSRYCLNGTLNGTCDFIERVLGIRYYYPGLGIVAPKITELSLKPVSYTDEPYFHHRYNYAFNLKTKSIPWKNVQKTNNFNYIWRMCMSTRWIEACHSPDPHRLLSAFPDKKDVIFFKDKTGYMYYNPATHIGNLMDITNPELAKLLVYSYKKYYDTDGKWRAPWGGWYPPNSEYAIFGQADTFVNDLKTEKNKHLFPESRKNNSAGMLSDLYVNFYCWICNDMKKQLPGKRLSVLAYHNYTLPPVVCKNIPDNLDVQVCMGRIVLAKSKSQQKVWKDTFGGWYKALGGRKVSAWTYGEQSTAFTKAIQGRYMKDFIQTLKPWLSQHGFFCDAGGLDWEFYYSYYPVYRCFWNPDFDVDAALDEHWVKLYGPKAGAFLKKFYTLLVRRWEDVGIRNFDLKTTSANESVSPALLYQTFNLNTVNELEKLLKQAYDATKPGSIERTRVEYFSLPWKKDFIAARAYCTLVIPSYEVRQLSKKDKIVIDGNLDEPIWKRAHVIPMQDAKGRGIEPTSKPCGKMVWDKTGIYFSFTCEGTPRIRKGDLWFASDNIEFFLSPGTQKATYYQFAVSPGNDLFDAYKVEKPMEAALDGKWSCAGLKRAVVAEKNRWTVEMYIPFSGLHKTPAPKAYTAWFGNLVNNKLAAPGTNAEYSAFSMTMGSNHNHALWGKFKFMGKGD